MYQTTYLITEEKDENTLNEIFIYIKEKYESEVLVSSTNKIFEDVEEGKKILYLLYLDDNNIKNFFQKHLQKKIPIGILPNDNCSITNKNYGISKNLKDAIDDAFNSELLSKIDLLKCNDSIAFNRISIGDMHGMNRYDYNENSRFKKIRIFFDNLKNISFKSYTIQTSKEHCIKTAASGITILEHSSKTNQESAIRDELSIHDGKLNAYILAPTSLVSYITYLLAIFFYQRISLVSLPKSLGFIKSSKLTISSVHAILLLKTYLEINCNPTTPIKIQNIANTGVSNHLKSDKSSLSSSNSSNAFSTLSFCTSFILYL